MHIFLAEICRIQSGGKPPGRDTKFVDVYHEKPVRLTVRAVVPVKEHPKVRQMGSQPRSSVVAQILYLFPVQLRGEAAGSEGELDEAAAGRHHDEDGGARAGVNAEQAAGTRMYVEYSDNKSNKVTLTSS